MKINTFEKEIINDKAKGLSDQEIGNKYNINLKQIEKIITKEKGINVTKLNKSKKINNLFPKDFKLENNTVWSFKSRGNWATHNGNYRGNWSPYIPRNVILRYSNENDTVLDYFCGSGTTAVECKLLNRNFIGIDINEKAIELARENLDFQFLFSSNIELKVGDARNLDFIKDNSIDLICAHPPYANIINYTYDNKYDLSHLNINEFLTEIKKIADESYRVLKENKYCAILIGDTRKNKHIVPLGFWLIEKYLEAGFKIKEIVIKRQHNCKTTGFWYKNSIKYNFLLLAHEYLVVFEKTKKKVQYHDKNVSNIFYLIDENIYLESTTVWIFNKEEYINNIISNLVKRYSKNYCIYNNNFHENSDLIIYFYDKNFNSFIKYMEKVKNNSIVAIVCEDIREENNLIYSEPIFIEKELRNNNNFKIKEIVIIAINNYSNNINNNKNNLNINHKYILIYQKVN